MNRLRLRRARASGMQGGAAPGLFTPEFLFGGGRYGGGLWYANRLINGAQNLYQDAAGTIPVTADGDPVGLIIDSSGNGNHMLQTVAGSCPTYKTDGTYEWLLPDGIDDYMVTAGNVDMKGSTSSSMFVAIEQSTTPSLAYLELSPNPANTSGTTGLTTASTGSNSYRHRGTINRTMSSSLADPETSTVVAGRGDIAAPAGELWINGVVANQNTSTQGTGTLINHQVYLLSSGGISAFFDRPWYGGLLISRYLTGPTLARTSDYFGSRMP